MLPTPEMLSSIPFQYAADVRSGKLLVGNRIKQAVERFYSWIETAEKKGYTLEHNEAIFMINLFPFLLEHTSGDMAGTPFLLSPYQQFTFYNIFAWKRFDNKGNKVRVIRKVYEKVARKNGKTAALAGLGLICQAFDEEKGAEVYVGATMEKQAKLVWTQAVNFINKSKRLRDLGYSHTQSEIRFPANVSIFKPVSKQFQNLDGLRPSLGILDEYHSHATDGVKQVIVSGMGSRLSPILYIITTAGFNKASVCKQYEDVCKEILEGTIEDDSTFVMIHDIDDGDDWEDEKIWAKANPNLDVSVSLDFLRTEYITAKNQPSDIPNFKTKYLNMWVEAMKVWIPTEKWENNNINKNLSIKSNKRKEIPLSVFEKFGAYAGLDLSTNIDITAFVILSEPDENGRHYIKPFLFCPEETIDKRSKEDKVPYRMWRDLGYLIATPGDVVDYDIIEDYIKSNFRKHNIKRLEVDRWNAGAIVNHLTEESYEVSYCSQGIANLTHPTKVFEKLVYEGKMLHDGNPVMTWMLSGCELITDNNGNIRISKGKAIQNAKRIDGIAALINAIAGHLSPKEETSKYSKPLDESEIYV